MNYSAILPLTLLLPLAGSLLVGLTGFLSKPFRQQKTLMGVIGTLMVAAPFAIFLAVFLGHTFANGQALHFTVLQDWLRAGSLNIGFTYMLDPLSLTMALIVTGVGALIHLYSIGYMRAEEGFYKYFAYLNLFIFAMLNLVLADNLLVTFLGWEGVGACSYFLIGFWFEREAYAKAAQKAFVANRVGDFFYLVAMFVLFQEAGTLAYPELAAHARAEGFGDAGIWASLLIFLAATGKSAQIPLFVWLPDAMAGPTPVSALIHAATMVTSGVYLIARLSFMYLGAPDVMLLVSAIGALTAIMAALIALTQNDIKKVLAYSTVSQLGFMFMALGAGAFTAAIFHVMTHAFFKACLFLGSGSVIHAMHHAHAADDPQDIRTMGGLGRYMPSTSATFWVSTFAIAGIPLLSGFFSKDEILGKTFAAGHESALYYGVWATGVVTAFLTAFYMTRLSTLVFTGKPRFDAEGHAPHESPAVMTAPLWVLACLAVVGGYVGIPEVFGHGQYHVFNTGWLNQVVQNRALHAEAAVEFALIGLSILVAVAGMFAGHTLYKRHGIAADHLLARSLGGLYALAASKFRVDEVYDKCFIRPLVALSQYGFKFFDSFILDGMVDLTGWVTAQTGFLLGRLQNGVAQSYALMMMAGVLAVLGYMLFA